MEEAAAENLENFIEWAANLGISDSPFITMDTDDFRNPNDAHSCSCLGQSLSLSFFPNAGGRGLGAVRDLQEGELILRIPKSALMTSECLVLNDHRLNSCVFRSSLSPTQVLTVALLNEVAKGKSSWWYPYLTQYPGSYDILASFGQFEIQALQLEDAIWAAEKAVNKSKLEWRSATAIMQELMLKPRYMSFKAWIWASASLSSRTMHIPWDAAGCFCPVGDFFNYAAPGGEQIISEDLTTAGMGVKLDGERLDAKLLRLTDGVFEEKSGAYCFYARKNYRKGDQVLLSYGTYTNLELLEHYGFVLNENPNDKAHIPLPPDLHSLTSWPADSLYIHHDGNPSFALLSAMRLWATPPHLRKSVGRLAYSGSPISTANETAVMEFIAKQCRLTLENLPTSIEEDRSLLRVMDNDFRSAMELKNALGGSREARDFLEAISLMKEELCSMTPLLIKATRALDKWKLAIAWRLGYKAMLRDCIQYCTRDQS